MAQEPCPPAGGCDAILTGLLLMSFLVLLQSVLHRGRKITIWGTQLWPRCPFLLPSALRMRTKACPPSFQPQLLNPPSPSFPSPGATHSRSFQFLKGHRFPWSHDISTSWPPLPVTPVLPCWTLPTPQFCFFFRGNVLNRSVSFFTFSRHLCLSFMGVNCC